MEAAVRGVRQIHAGDLTGRRQQSVNEEARARAEQLERVITELRDPNTALVWLRCDGRSSEYPVPREVAEHLTTSKRGSSR